MSSTGLITRFGKLTRRGTRIALMLVLGATAGIAGCEKLPWGNADSEVPSTPSGPPPDTATIAHNAAAASTTPALPPPPTPQQVIDRFQSTPPPSRTDADLAALAQLPEGREQIAELDLHDSRITNAGMAHVPALPAVTVLNIAGTRIAGEGLEPIGRMQNLESLTLDRVPAQDDGFAHVGKAVELRELSANGLPISDQAVLSLKDLSRLEVLRLGNNTRLLGREFSALLAAGAFPHLRVLQVDGSGFGYYGLNDVGRLKGLEELSAMNCEVGDAALPLIAGCTSLRVLRLGNNRITDAGLKTVPRLRNLEELDLGGNVGVTDAGLAALRSAKPLKRLILEGTRCTPEAARRLKDKSLPSTTIRIGGQDI